MNNAFMIAATGSGCGKTTITCALLKAIKKRGLTPKAFKCGPDYIDPMFHKAVLGIESQNLDLFFSDGVELRNIFYRENACDVAVVEGVMGLYDGISFLDNEGSSYDLAGKLDIPVVLVVNAHGMGRSLLAVIGGYKAMDEDNRIKAVILNNISKSYFEKISQLIEEELEIPVIGYLPRISSINLKSRYLGLKMPNEIENLEGDVEKAADIISETVELERLFEISKVSKNKAPEPGDDKLDNKAPEPGGNIVTDIEKKANHIACHKVRIGMARDDAFCFYFEENLRLLKKMGAEIVEFSPLKDSKLPSDIDGLIFFGGYPELFAEELSQNKSMRLAVKEALETGMPSLAECGGFMYLHKEICVDGTAYPMVGLIDGTCAKSDSLVRFGYMTIQEKNGLFLQADRKSIKGHEFHYYDSTDNGRDAISSKPDGERSWEAAHIGNNHWWGFAHLYYPSNAAFAEAFLNKCEEWRKDNG